jgi:hypothetical protein
VSAELEDVTLPVAPFAVFTLGEFRRFTAALPDDTDIHLVTDAAGRAEITIITELSIPPAEQCDGQAGLLIRYEVRDMARVFGVKGPSPGRRTEGRSK